MFSFIFISRFLGKVDIQYLNFVFPSFFLLCIFIFYFYFLYYFIKKGPRTPYYRVWNDSDGYKGAVTFVPCLMVGWMRGPWVVLV